MKSLFLALIAVLTLIFASAAATVQAAETAGTNPAIAQPLVREGTLAVSLAQALNIGAATDEAQAESLLSAAGIAPKNGWIADYPVTPDVAGELQSAVVLASESGALKMAKDDAVSAFQGTMNKYGLSVKGDTSSEGADVSSAPSYSDNPELLNDYYNEEGPPVVTYYAPPPDYAYLYSWVPYPFWWYDYWFPGFFVLIDFDRTVIVHGHRHHFSNHFFNHRGRFARLDAAERFHRFHGSAFGSRDFNKTPALQRQQDVTRGMNAIAGSRRGLSAGSGSISVSPGGGTQMRQPFRGRGGTFLAPSGRNVTTGQAATNSFSQFRAGSIRQQSAPAKVAPSVNSNMRSYGSYSRPFEGGRTLDAAPHWEGGHSFGGFRGSSGGRFGR